MGKAQYERVVSHQLAIPSGEDWNERFILALFINRLKLAAEPTQPYHIMAPMPVLGSPITWDQAYIVECNP